MAGNPKPKGHQEAEKRLDYLSQPLRPAISLLFVLPLLLCYELASTIFPGTATRSGIDLWTHQLLEPLGIGNVLFLPVLTIGLLVYWQHQQNDQWNFPGPILLGMLIESICLGTVLFFAGNAIYSCFDVSISSSLESIQTTSVSWNNTVAFIGCAVYEESIFRLFLLRCLILWLCKSFDKIHAAWMATLIVSFLFASLHFDFLNPAGNPFVWQDFLFL
ncbi:MAG: CPBP family glutamic-type intramembrane protease, partial [Planctomycetota bacterium]